MKRGKNRGSLSRKIGWGTAALTTMLLFGAMAAVAADRMVIAENFTSTTCGYCPYAGRALHRMMTNYPDTFVSTQIHVSGGYTQTPWATNRYNSYGGGGTPLTWFDGVLQCLGAYTNDTQMFNWYKDQYNARIAVPTDLSITMTGEQTGANSYDIHVTVSMDPGGTARSMICHVVQALDYYPASTDNRYRNCARLHQQDTFTLNPGESYTFTKSFTLAAVDVTNIDNVKIIAFAQIPGSSGAREIYNAAVMNYPFPPPQNDVIGDVDGDGDVDLSDLAALLATYGLCDGDPGYNSAADFIENSCIDLADLAALLGNYGYPG